MGKNIKNTQADELSSCLDILNEGNYPVMQDQEIEDLIEMAAVIKKSHAQDELPRELIAQVVDKLASELGAEKEKKAKNGRVYWLYSGLVGAAATIVIVLGANLLLPQFLDKNIAQEISNTTEPEKIMASKESTIVGRPTNDKIGEHVEKIYPRETTTEKNTANNSGQLTSVKSDESISKVLVEILQVVQSKVNDEDTTQVASLEKKNSENAVVSRNLLVAKNDVNIIAQTDKLITLPRSSDIEIINNTKKTEIQVGKNTEQPMAMAGYMVRNNFAAKVNNDDEKVAAPLPLTIMVNRRVVNFSKGQVYTKANGTVMIPLQEVVAILGYKVTWDKEVQTVKLTKDAQSHTFKIGEDKYDFRKETTVVLGERSEVIGGIIYVPVQFFSKVLQMNVSEDKSGIIKIHDLVW